MRINGKADKRTNGATENLYVEKWFTQGRERSQTVPFHQIVKDKRKRESKNIQILLASFAFIAVRFENQTLQKACTSVPKS